MQQRRDRKPATVEPRLHIRHMAVDDAVDLADSACTSGRHVVADAMELYGRAARMRGNTAREPRSASIVRRMAEAADEQQVLPLRPKPPPGTEVRRLDRMSSVRRRIVGKQYPPSVADHQGGIGLRDQAEFEFRVGGGAGRRGRRRVWSMSLAQVVQVDGIEQQFCLVARFSSSGRNFAGDVVPVDHRHVERGPCSRKPGRDAGGGKWRVPALHAELPQRLVYAPSALRVSRQEHHVRCLRRSAEHQGSPPCARTESTNIGLRGQCVDDQHLRLIAMQQRRRRDCAWWLA